MESILDTAKALVNRHIQTDSVAADFTMGNGHDTLFLSQKVPDGRVYAFDIQPAALESTRRRLEENGAPSNYTLILDSHSNLERHLAEEIDVGMFNLGYLPYQDKSLTTKTSTTLEAVEKALAMLKKDGILVIVVYPGHPEGALEGEALQKRLSSLDAKRYDVLLHRLIHVPSAPYILAVERRK